MAFLKRGRDDLEQVTIDTIGGKGKMKITQFFGKDVALPHLAGSEDDFGSCLHFLHELIMGPGTQIGEHTHKGSEEIYFIVEGSGELTVDGEVIQMKEGDAVLTGNNSTHSFIVTSPGPAKLIVVEAGVF